jgi:hypothetical protein
MREEWKLFEATTFVIEILEKIKKKETQTEREFTDDVHTLLELHTEKEMLITQGKDKHV